MAVTLNTNVASPNTYNLLNQTSEEVTTSNVNTQNSLEKLSAGLKINKAADDASGFIMEDRLRTQSISLGQIARNANDAISIVQTADGALEEQVSIVNTIKTKSIQATSDSQTTGSRQSIQTDIDALKEENDTISSTTSFNGQKLLNGNFNQSIQVGTTSDESINTSINSSNSNNIGATRIETFELSGSGAVSLNLNGKDIGPAYLGDSSEDGLKDIADKINNSAVDTGITASTQNGQLTLRGSNAEDIDFSISAKQQDSNISSNVVSEKTLSLKDIDVTTQEGAENSIAIADNALRDLDEMRSNLGSTQNQLTSTLMNMSSSRSNGITSESQIRDVDFAEESKNFSKINISEISQIGGYAMSQANAMQQNVMRLLQ